MGYFVWIRVLRYSCNEKCTRRMVSACSSMTTRPRQHSRMQDIDGTKSGSGHVLSGWIDRASWSHSGVRGSRVKVSQVKVFNARWAREDDDGSPRRDRYSSNVLGRSRGRFWRLFFIRPQLGSLSSCLSCSTGRRNLEVDWLVRCWDPTNTQKVLTFHAISQ